MLKFFQKLFTSKNKKEIDGLKLRISTLECKIELLMKNGEDKINGGFKNEVK